MATKYIFVTGGVVSGLGKRNNSCVTWPFVKIKRIESDNAEIRSIFEY